MTDLEKVVNMFESLGVPMTLDNEENGCTLITLTDSCDDFGEGKVRGYSGFYTYYAFDAEGKFEFIGIYE